MPESLTLTLIAIIIALWGGAIYATRRVERRGVFRQIDRSDPL